MHNKLFIKDVLEFFKKNKFDYSFKGNENDYIDGFSSLFNYKKKSMTFISTLYNFNDFKHMFDDKKIQLIITAPSQKKFPSFKNVIQVKNPKRVFFLILEEFYDGHKNFEYDCLIKNNTNYSFISKHANIGKNVKIGFGSIIEDNVIIGDNTEIHHNVVIRSNTKIGNNCTIYSGTIIGERGFNPNTLEDGSRKMLKHYGGVTIEDNVHIGDNCTIAKGAIDDTIIKRGAKLNTAVHVAHNCIIGRNTVVTLPTHICGSVVIGENCHIAAVAIRNQCKIGDGATLGLGAVVVKDVPAGITVIGNPAKPLNLDGG